MKSEAIVDSGLFVRLDLDLSLKTNALFQTNPLNRAHLANQLLLYEKLVIPTKDFGIIPILINWLGYKTFEKALDLDVFFFLHRKGLLGYAGDGNGIAEFVISESDSRKFEWWQRALFGEIEDAVEQQLRNMCPFVGKKERENIVQRISSKSKNVDYTNDFFTKNIVRETYTDIMENPILSSLILKNAQPGLGKIDLTRLEGINANQMRVSRFNIIQDSIDFVLRIAEVNMEVFMSTLANDADLFTLSGAELLLKHKVEKSGIGSNYLPGFSSLLELNSIPDVGQAIISDSLSLMDIWEMRERKISKEFREWLRKATSKDAREIEKLYVESIGKKTLANSLPLRVLRFAIISVAGVLCPGIGLSLDGVDCFFVDKWLRGYSPRLYLDQFSKLRIENKKGGESMTK